MRTWILAAALALAAPARASQFVTLDFPALMAETQDVVRARVVRTTSWWTEDGSMMYTAAEIRVVQGLYGPYRAGDLLVVREVGGIVDGYAVAAVGFPRFVVGDEIVAFLGQWEDDGSLRVAGYAQGFYRVVTVGGVERLVPGRTQDLPDAPPGEIPGPVPRNTPVRALAARLSP